MPAYGVAQAGWNQYPNQGLNLTSVIPNETFVFLNGKETGIASGYKSVACARGVSASNVDNGMTFYVSGCALGTTILVEGSNQDVDGDYFVLDTITPDANGNGAFTDVGRAAYWRGVIGTLVNGDAPVMIGQR